MKLLRDIVLVAAAIIAIALLADAWRNARQDSQQLTATLAAQNKQIQQAATREDQRDSQLATTLAAIQNQKRSIHTPEQAAAKLSSVLPPLPLPISTESTRLSPPPEPQPSDPTDPPAMSLTIPKPDLIPLYNALQDCRASTLQNNSLQKDLSDERSLAAALKQERDAAISNTKGGTLLTRIKRATKWFLVGLTVGVVVAAATHR